MTAMRVREGDRLHLGPISVPEVSHITETEQRRAGALLREIIDSSAEAVTVYGERNGVE